MQLTYLIFRSHSFIPLRTPPFLPQNLPQPAHPKLLHIAVITIRPRDAHHHLDSKARPVIFVQVGIVVRVRERNCRTQRVLFDEELDRFVKSEMSEQVAELAREIVR